MAFDEVLADRVREKLTAAPGVAEKRMFGGIAFLTHGNMTVGVHGDELIARINPDDTDAHWPSRAYGSLTSLAGRCAVGSWSPASTWTTGILIGG